MTKHSVPEIANGAPAPFFPTSAHRQAFSSLRVYAEHYFGRESTNRAKEVLKCRHNRLISGPSGVGKSHLGGMLARTTGARLIEINYGDWIPVGSSTKPCSLVQIAMALVEYERVILMIDEVDKLVSSQLQSTWSVCCQNEVYSLLERSLPMASMYNEFKDQTKALPASFADCFEVLKQAVRSSLFIIACGTWQAARSSIRSQASHRVVFEEACQTNRPCETAFSTRDAIQKQHLIPEELRNRFHGEIIELRYPDKEETGHLIERLGIADLATKAGRPDLVESLDLSKGGMRELESLYTDLLITCETKQIESLPIIEKPCMQRQYTQPESAPEEDFNDIGFLV